MINTKPIVFAAFAGALALAMGKNPVLFAAGGFGAGQLFAPSAELVDTPRRPTVGGGRSPSLAPGARVVYKPTARR